MRFIVNKRSLFLLAVILCVSKLVAMDDATPICPYCGQPNFELGSRIYLNASTGEDISDVYKNIHIECLKANGLLRKTPESEFVHNFLRASGFIVGTCVGTALVHLFDGYASPDNFSEIVLYFQEFAFLVPIGIYAKNKIPEIYTKLKNNFFSNVSTPNK